VTTLMALYQVRWDLGSNGAGALVGTLGLGFATIHLFGVGIETC
jgi:hypothetical protein